MEGEECAKRRERVLAEPLHSAAGHCSEQCYQVAVITSPYEHSQQ